MNKQTLYYTYLIKLLVIFSIITLLSSTWTLWVLVYMHIDIKAGLVNMITFYIIINTIIISIGIFTGIKKWRYMPFLYLPFTYNWLNDALDVFASYKKYGFKVQVLYIHLTSMADAISGIILIILAYISIIVFFLMKQEDHKRV